MSLSGLRVLCCPDRSGSIDAAWLAGLRSALPGARLCARADRAGAEGLEPWSGPEQIDSTMGDHLEAGEALLVIRSGLRFGPDVAARIAALERWADRLDLIILPGNYHPGLNPFAGLPGVDATTDPHSLVAAAGTGEAQPVRLPRDALALMLPTTWRGRHAPRAGLVDDLFLHDQERPLDAGKLATPDGQAAFGLVRQRLGGLLDAGLRGVPELDGSQRPLTLHISHSWGGGVARWIHDQCRGDSQGHHLVLCAGGDESGREHGQYLRLFSGQADAAPLAEWPLAPAIADTVSEHAAYAALLDQIIRRFGVARVIVSSLIGHSLDALRTGQPTLVMLHDFYPLTPLLHEDPLICLDAEGRLDLGQAIARQSQPLLFEHEDPIHWKALGEAWLAAVQQNGLKLVAPTRHVATRWAALSEGRLPEVEVVPHGFHAPEHWPRALDFEPDSADRLRLVVVGRISEGKGLRLLDGALDELQSFARITLLGAGRDAFSLFGRRGVDIVLNYQAEALAGQLAMLRPDAVLFLSTVPETWNYVLSEIRALGLTPMATRLGSFEERIDEGVDGVLFDPDPDALIEVARGWQHRREALRALGRRAQDEPTLYAAAAAYRALLPEGKAIAAWSPLPASSAAMTGLLSEAQRADQRRLAALSERVGALQADLENRTDWARRCERLAQERTVWAQSLEATVEDERRQSGELSAALERTELALRASRHELVENQARINELTVELDAARAAVAAHEQHLQLISNSLSWRLTRPLRFAARLARKGQQRRAWNPLRWPTLLASAWRVFRRDGRAGLIAGLYPVDASGGSPIDVISAAGDDLSPPEDQPLRAVRFALEATPRVSIVIPVYNKVALTSACLNSLAEAGSETAFEVIVIDDCSSDETPDYLAECQGLRALRNEENAGFIDSCNRGAAEARGDFLVFLNNDTTVTEGWLDALIAPFDGGEGVGIVGARLVYPDGRLQEAGGIVFSDASGWNYGKGGDPAAPQYGFLSEADYVSGACLAIRRSDFDAVGGFDTRFRPAYYEDTDLCFQMRARGKRVLVQPACTIIHHEGATSGTDEGSGAKRYQAVNRERFLEKWGRALAEHPPPEPNSSRADPVRHLRYRRFSKRALVIDATTPQPDHDSGSVRIRAVMDLLLTRGFQVTFMAENRRYVPGYTDQLTQAGIEVLHAPAVPDLDAWLSEHGGDLDLVFVSRHYVLVPLLATLRQHAERALLVFDTVDLHFLREQREAELLRDEVLARQAETSRRQELRLVAQADVSLVVSPVEQALLQQEVPGADIRVLSNIHRVRGRGAPWSARSGLLFVGGFQHLPNVDAAHWLASEIFPLIRSARPDMALHLVGSRMPESILALAERPGILVHGFVEDLEPILNSVRVSVAPLRYGAGVKGKVNQAMSYGLPVVATTCAAEGMYLENERDVLVADEAGALADAVIRLDQDEALWNRLADGGLANVEAHFSMAAADSVLAELEAASAAGSDEGRRRRQDDPVRAAGGS